MRRAGLERSSSLIAASSAGASFVPPFGLASQSRARARAAAEAGPRGISTRGATSKTSSPSVSLSLRPPAVSSTARCAIWKRSTPPLPWPMLPDLSTANTMAAGLIERRWLRDHGEHRLERRFPIAATRKRTFPAQHHQADTAVPYCCNQRVPEPWAGIGDGHVVEHHHPIAVERFGLGVEPRNRDHIQCPPAAQQTTRKHPGRALRIQHGRARHDVDHGGVGPRIEGLSRRRIFYRCIYSTAPVRSASTSISTPMVYFMSSRKTRQLEKSRVSGLRLQQA